MAAPLDWQTGNAWAGIRRIPVAGPFATSLPVGGIQRGSVITIGGEAGFGATSAALLLAAAATSVGEWVAFIDPGSLGGKAAIDAGIELDRCAVIRDVAHDRWAVTVGALLDGVALVCAAIPGRLALGDARRLQARARERQAVLVILETLPGIRVGAWPGEAALRITAVNRADGADDHSDDVGSSGDIGRFRYEVSGKGIARHLQLACAG